MTTVNCTLGVERLCELAAEHGLSHFEVVEATLVHSVRLTDNAAFNDILKIKVASLDEHVINSALEDDVVSIERYICTLLYEVRGLLAEMEKLNVIHIKRAQANWEVVEKIIKENDPLVAKVLAAHQRHRTER